MAGQEREMDTTPVEQEYRRLLYDGDIEQSTVSQGVAYRPVRSRVKDRKVSTFNVILVLFGLATLISFCPSPCQTAWPVGEVAIWSNILIGVPATFMVARNLLSRTNQVK